MCGLTCGLLRVTEAKASSKEMRKRTTVVNIASRSPALPSALIKRRICLAIGPIHAHKSDTEYIYAAMTIRFEHLEQLAPWLVVGV